MVRGTVGGVCGAVLAFGGGGVGGVSACCAFAGGSGGRGAADAAFGGGGGWFRLGAAAGFSPLYPPGAAFG